MAHEAKDPVCGMTVDTSTAEHTHYDGKEYFFCSATCKAKFEKNPKQYTARSA